MKTRGPVIDLNSLPLILTLADMAMVYRCSQSTIRRGVQTGTFFPRPVRKYPYRWRREDVAADLARPASELPRRRHGFARLALAKASLTKPTKQNAG